MHFIALPLAFVLYILLSYAISFFQNKNAVYEEQMFYSVINYAVLIFCLLITVKSFLKFPVKKLFGDFHFRDLASGMASYGLPLIITTFIWMFLSPSSFSYTFDSSRFIILWICTFITLSLSALSEELIFRSYIAYFFSDDIEKSPKKIILYCIASGLLFASAHFMNPEVAGEKAFYAMLFYFIIGSALMLCFMKSERIWFSLGIHLSNNLVSAFLFSYPDSVIRTNSVFTQYDSINVFMIIQTILCLLVSLIIFFKSRVSGIQAQIGRH